MEQEKDESEFQKRRDELKKLKEAKFGKRLAVLLRIDHKRLAIYTLELHNKFDELEQKLIVALKRLKKYEPERGDSPDYSDYDKTWTNIRKVVFVVSRNFNPLSSTRVLEELLKLEASFEYDWDNPANVVSGLLSRAVKKGLITKQDSPLGSPLYFKK